MSARRNGRVLPYVEAAHAYSGLGWALVPCDGKAPKGRDWQRTQPVEPDLAAGKWSQWGERWNLGIVLGPSGLAVLDVDRDHAEEAVIALLGELPETPICRTGSNRLHVYFRDPGGLEKRTRDGFELRVGAHQVIAPPSVHPETGKAYAWLEGCSPSEVALAPLPAELVAYFAAEESKRGPAPEIGETIAEGKRNETLASLAGSWRRRGASEAEIRAALEVANRDRCTPPLPAEDVARIAHSVSRYAPAEKTEAEPPARDLVLTPLSQVQPREIEYVDYPLLQASAFHLVVGRKGAGKGTTLADIAARVTRGELGTKRSVIWIGSEDSASIDVRPRVEAAGGGLERVHVMTAGWLYLPGDIGWIIEQAHRIGDVGLIVIDPVSNHLGTANSNADADVRTAIAPLNDVADQLACMLIGVRHLSEKECQRGILASILGASAWVQVPRVVLALVRDDLDPELAHLQCIAGNRLPPDTPGRMLRIQGYLPPGFTNEVTRVAWLGDSSKDVETLLPARKKNVSKTEQARTVLLDLLEAAPGMRMESDELDARVAAATGLAAGTVRNVRNELRGDGLVRSEPERADDDTFTRWFVLRTNAPRTAASSPVHDSESEA